MYLMKSRHKAAKSPAQADKPTDEKPAEKPSSAAADKAPKDQTDGLFIVNVLKHTQFTLCFQSNHMCCGLY